jgi:hypothetical protein
MYFENGVHLVAATNGYLTYEILIQAANCAPPFTRKRVTEGFLWKMFQFLPLWYYMVQTEAKTPEMKDRALLSAIVRDVSYLY